MSDKKFMNDIDKMDKEQLLEEKKKLAKEIESKIKKSFSES